MSAVNCPNPLTRRREYLRSPIARKVGGPLKAMSFLMSTQAAAFSPADIASLTHWYDATEITASDNDTVATWADQEGTDDLSQATGSKQPTYKTNIIGGNPIVRFDGTDDYLDVSFSTLSQPNQVFIVLKKQTNGTDTSLRFIMDGIDSSNRHAPYVNNGDWRFTAETGTAIVSAVSIDTDPHINATLANGASSTLRLDGTQIASGDAGADNLTGLTVGSRNSQQDYGDFDIGEILVYDASLSTSDRDSVESYLSDKWGVTI